MLSLSPVAESATLLRRVGVVVGSVLVTLGYCLDVLWRAAFRRLDRARVDRYTRGWASKLLRLVRLQVTVFGKAPDFSDGRRYMVLCTHASHYDIPVSFVALPGSIRMLAKAELYRIPVLGVTMRLVEFPSINRHNRERAFADLLSDCRVAALQERLLSSRTGYRRDHRPGRHPWHSQRAARAQLAFQSRAAGVCTHR